MPGQAMVRRKTRAATSQPNSQTQHIPLYMGTRNHTNKKKNKINIQVEQVLIFKPLHSTHELLRKVKFHTLNP